jgi:hypothetical protein
MQSQPVEYLASTEARLNDPTTGEQVVVITIRPDPLVSFEVVNLAIPVPQAQRLLTDLTNLLGRSCSSWAFSWRRPLGVEQGWTLGRTNGAHRRVKGPG